MAMAQLNVRIDPDLKAAGDAVLERFGASAVKVIRDAWQYMADHQKLPDYDLLANAGSKNAQDGNGIEDQILAEAERGEGMAVRLAREVGIRASFESMTYSEIRETAYEEMLIEEAERLA